MPIKTENELHAATEGVQIESVLVCNNIKDRLLTLLSTAEIAVKTFNNETYHARVLLDSASTNNLITRKLAGNLKLKQDEVDISISEVNLNTTKLSNSVDVSINSLCSNYKQSTAY